MQFLCMRVVISTSYTAFGSYLFATMSYPVSLVSSCAAHVCVGVLEACTSSNLLSERIGVALLCCLKATERLTNCLALLCCLKATERLTNCLHFEVKALALLKTSNDFEQIPSLRIAVRAEHAHQALG